MNNYALIIGAKSDIAKAMAWQYAQKGYNLFLAARNSDSLKEDASDLSIRHKIDVIPCELDILDYSHHENFLDNLEPFPEIIVCAAGYLGDQQKAEQDQNEARLIMETNYNACASLLNLTAKKLEDKGSGTIIGISSVAGDRGRMSNYFYGSAKGGFSDFLSGLRSRLAKKGIHVMTLKPGFVATKMTEGMDLPGLLTASPDEVAKAAIKGAERKANILYCKWFWRYIMTIIQLIPEFIFKKLKL